MARKTHRLAASGRRRRDRVPHSSRRRLSSAEPSPPSGARPRQTVPPQPQGIQSPPTLEARSSWRDQVGTRGSHGGKALPLPAPSAHRLRWRRAVWAQVARRPHHPDVRGLTTCHGRLSTTPVPVPPADCRCLKRRGTGVLATGSSPKTGSHTEEENVMGESGGDGRSNWLYQCKDSR